MDFRFFGMNRRKSAVRRALRPRLESLEDRKLLYATLGDAWVFPARVTYSFVPDGTDVIGSPSALYSKMSQQGVSQATWQNAFQEAAAIWEAVTNINLVQVSDNGAAFGTPGNQQGDSRFGDIRIGEIPLLNGGLALTFSPPPANGGTIAGDIVINSSYNWNPSTGYDLETVALHEFGHALGLDHTNVSYAVMYAYYNSTKNILASDDIAGIQSIYGARQNDAFDAQVSNQVFTAATNLNGYISAGRATIPNLDLTTNNDVDWYKVTVPSNTNGTFTVTMQSTGLSSLSPRFYIRDSGLRAVGLATAPYSYGATISLTVNGVSPNQVYYIQASEANDGGSGVGAYGLQLNFVGGSMTPIAPPVTTVAQQADGQGGSLNLEPSSPSRHGVPSWIGSLIGNGNPFGFQGGNGGGNATGSQTITIGNFTAKGDYLMPSPDFHAGTASPSTNTAPPLWDVNGTDVPAWASAIYLVLPTEGSAKKDRGRA